jgi:EAL domain-containing protein (putative c-di-GMP-specific phosphodiesterase class I)
VLRQACTQTAAWRDRGNDLTVAVNVSGRQLDRDVIVEHVREALERSGLDPAALIIEITETALMRNVDTTARRLHDLRALGVRVAIDDFGTGYSSLAYLQRFPVDCLKIDRTFTNAIARSPESDALIHTLVQLGKDLGLKTLAEGVETIDQLDHLRREHVNEVQGFLLARPLDARTLETQLLEPARTTEPSPDPAACKAPMGELVAVGRAGPAMPAVSEAADLLGKDTEQTTTATPDPSQGNQPEPLETSQSRCCQGVADPVGTSPALPW